MYEFYGDHCHGNPKVCVDQDIAPHKKTMVYSDVRKSQP